MISEQVSIQFAGGTSPVKKKAENPFFCTVPSVLKDTFSVLLSDVIGCGGWVPQNTP
jgi:hypothetical protein